MDCLNNFLSCSGNFDFRRVTLTPARPFLRWIALLLPLQKRIAVKLPILIFFLLAFCCAACRAQPVSELRLGPHTVVLLLDSTQAARTITTDMHDRIFEHLTAAEMSIQMKKPLLAGQTRVDILPQYLAFLRSDVVDFNAQEAKFTTEVFEKVYKTTESVVAGIFPDTLKIIKTKGRHYGDGVYYTRDNCIIIPANELESRKRDNFTTTMFHELFHVYSRLNAVKRQQLYALIGFTDIGLDKLQMPSTLSERTLYNPDGVNFAQKINVTAPDGTPIQAVPILFASNLGYANGRDEFFSYLEFSLFQIKPNADGTWQVLVAPNGYSSTLEMSKIPDFFTQIKDNTGYIIHPDEVLADNFAFLMGSKKSPALIAKFSTPGKKLLEDIEMVLKQP